MKMMRAADNTSEFRIAFMILRIADIFSRMTSLPFPLDRKVQYDIYQQNEYKQNKCD